MASIQAIRVSHLHSFSVSGSVVVNAVEGTVLTGGVMIQNGMKDGEAEMWRGTMIIVGVMKDTVSGETETVQR